ncbi:MAG: dockerin type I repeat-containing protein [Planctomycetota bacterium]
MAERVRLPKLPTCRALGVLGLALTLCGTGVSSQASGAVCTASVNPFGGCFQSATPHAGEFPFGITVNEDAGLVLVVDLFSGITYRYTKSNIGLPPQFFFGPVGAGFYTGIEWHPTEDALYYIVDDGAGQQLVKATNSGGLVASFPITSPAGGDIGDLTYSATTDTFWAVDYENDVCFEFNNMGALTGNSFSSPGQTGFGGGVFGTGLTVAEGSAVDPVLFDVPTGLPVALRATQVMRVTPLGAEVGRNFGLDGDNSLGGYVTGVAYTPNSGTDTSAPPDGIPDGPAVEFFLDITSNQLVEVRVATGSPTVIYSPTVTNLTCTADENNDVTLTWSNPGPYMSIEVLRSEAGSLAAPVSVAILTGADTTPGAHSFVDTMVPDGEYVYELEATTVNATAFLVDNRQCNVLVGVGRLVNVTPHNGEDALAITVVESPSFVGGDPADDAGLVYVVDLDSGVTHRYTKELVLVNTIATPFDDCGPAANQPCTTTGLAWNSTTDTLFWMDSSRRLQETDLLGNTIAPASTVNSPAGGVIGDFGYAALTNTFWAADITEDVYFEFNPNGSTTGNVITFAQLGLGSGSGFGNGVAVVSDANLVALDVPAAPSSASHVNQIVRIITDGTVVTSIPLDSTTSSAFVNGVAWTATGSGGSPAEYIVGNDTNAIYEISLAGGGTQLRRGDANDNGQVEISDVSRILNFIFGINTNLPCQDAADVNDDGQINVADVPVLLNGIFGIAGTQPAPPFPLCGTDMTPSILTCTTFASCP